MRLHDDALPPDPPRPTLLVPLIPPPPTPGDVAGTSCTPAGAGGRLEGQGVREAGPLWIAYQDPKAGSPTRLVSLSLPGWYLEAGSPTRTPTCPSSRTGSSGTCSAAIRSSGSSPCRPSWQPTTTTPPPCYYEVSIPALLPRCYIEV